MEHVQTVIVGAGVIGLAIARHLAVRGREVLILEAEAAIGRHVSSRNSGVIHAGLHYPPGSAEERLCLKGREMLYDYCASRHVGHRRLGKLTVAPDAAGVAALDAIAARGRANGLDDLRVITARELSEREPEVVGAGALLSPASGIVDAPGLMLSLLGEAEASGAMLALNARFLRARRARGRFQVEVGGGAEITLACDRLVNAAALGAWRVAAGIERLAADSIPPKNLARGNYFSFTGASPFSALIYPLPETGSLGIHSVPDLDGGLRFGPDMHWSDRPDYSVDPALLPVFEAEIRRYWPGLPSGALKPDMAGIRPRIWGPGGKRRAFEFQDASDHGVRGLVQLFGFESPGLTACLAIAEHVGELLSKGDRR